MTIKVLDLFCGSGGAHKGFSKVCDIEYTGIEIDPKICKIHKINNPIGTILEGNAYHYLSNLEKFNFIWASPPCKTHSRLNNVLKLPIDWRLFRLIEICSQLDIFMVVENVIPYYTVYYPLTPVQIDRHYFWANFPLESFDVPKTPKAMENMLTKDWEQYKGMIFSNKFQGRDSILPLIAENIFRQALKLMEIKEKCPY